MEAEWNDRLDSIWRKNFSAKPSVLAPLYYDKLRRDSLLFIGLNPSFNEQNISSFIRSCHPERDPCPRVQFSWKIDQPFDRSICLEEQRYSKKAYKKYYGLHDKIAGDVEWEQLDIFRFRESKKAALKDVRTQHKGFDEESQDLFVEVFCSLQPKLVVVINAEAVKLISNRLRVQSISANTDQDVIWCGERPIPAVFSGQHLYMAAPNLNLLIWHANRLVKRYCAQ